MRYLLFLMSIVLIACEKNDNNLSFEIVVNELDTVISNNEVLTECIGTINERYAGKWSQISTCTFANFDLYSLNISEDQDNEILFVYDTNCSFISPDTMNVYFYSDTLNAWKFGAPVGGNSSRFEFDLYSCNNSIYGKSTFFIAGSAVQVCDSLVFIRG